jgi:hypothetical protein
MRAILLGTAVWAAALAATPAAAADPSCLWNKLSKSERDHILAKDKAGLDQEDQEVLAKYFGGGCGVNGVNREPAFYVYFGYAQEEVAIHALEVRHLATRAQIGAGWAGLPNELKNRIMEAESRDQPLPGEAIPTFVQHMGVAGLSPESPAWPMLETYIRARARVDGYIGYLREP